MNNYSGIIGKLKLCAMRMYRSMLPCHCEWSGESLSEKDIIQRVAQGNFALQMGWITTSEEFESLRARVVTYEF